MLTVYYYKPFHGTILLKDQKEITTNIWSKFKINTTIYQVSRAHRISCGRVTHIYMEKKCIRSTSSMPCRSCINKKK